MNKTAQTSETAQKQREEQALDLLGEAAQTRREPGTPNDIIYLLNFDERDYDEIIALYGEQAAPFTFTELRDHAHKEGERRAFYW